MPDNQYTLKRARSGRFNFTFASAQGNIEGCVFVQIERHHTRAQIVEAAARKVEVLIGDLIAATDGPARPS